MRPLWLALHFHGRKLPVGYSLVTPWIRKSSMRRATFWRIGQSSKRYSLACGPTREADMLSVTIWSGKMVHEERSAPAVRQHGVSTIAEVSAGEHGSWDRDPPVGYKVVRAVPRRPSEWPARRHSRPAAAARSRRPGNPC